MQIRKMEKKDVKKIDDVFFQQGWGKRTAVLENYFKEQNEGTRDVFIAEMNGEVTGYVTLMPKALHGPFAHQYPEVADFNVFEKFQKRGIGNQLLEAAEKKAKTFTEVLTLGVGLHPGYGAAQRLYIKRGFIPDGSGIWFENRQLNMNEPCINNDDLVLYMSKRL